MLHSEFEKKNHFKVSELPLPYELSKKKRKSKKLLTKIKRALFKMQ